MQTMLDMHTASVRFNLMHHADLHVLQTATSFEMQHLHAAAMGPRMCNAESLRAVERDCIAEGACRLGLSLVAMHALLA